MRIRIRRPTMCQAGILLLLLASIAFAAPTTIRPGEIWPDNRGNHVQAHGGGIIRVDGLYYWFGEDRTKGLDRTKRYVSCYSSEDLAHWTFRNRVVQLSDPEGFGPSWVLERPKVFYNAKTKKYVMYMHIDGPEPGQKGGYNLARVGVAVADKVDGNYQYLKSFRPLGHESRDIGQFIDDDGTAYLIFEDRPFGFRIATLSDDYLTVEKEVCLIPMHMEGGAVVHYDGLYYAIGSALTGWSPNPNKYATAKSLAGPWSDFKDLAPPATKTYGSQSTMLLKVVGEKATTVIFMGDIWKPEAQWDSRYLWMPLEIGNGKLWLPEPKPWTLDVKAGVAAAEQ
ncbi:MAG: family 43 glycosylhydrolase [Bryobacteraceae bacterium]